MRSRPVSSAGSAASAASTAGSSPRPTKGLSTSAFWTYSVEQVLQPRGALQAGLDGLFCGSVSGDSCAARDRVAGGALPEHQGRERDGGQERVAHARRS